MGWVVDLNLVVAGIPCGTDRATEPRRRQSGVPVCPGPWMAMGPTLAASHARRRASGRLRHSPAGLWTTTAGTADDASLAIFLSR